MEKSPRWSTARFKRELSLPTRSLGGAASAYKNAKDAALAEFLSFLDTQKQKRGFLQRLLDKKVRRDRGFSDPADIDFGTFE